jgi:hypothetical protein
MNETVIKKETVEFQKWCIEYSVFECRIEFSVLNMNLIDAEPDFQVAIKFDGCSDSSGYLHFCNEDEPIEFWAFLYKLAEKELPYCDWSDLEQDETKVLFISGVTMPSDEEMSKVVCLELKEDD